MSDTTTRGPVSPGTAPPEGSQPELDDLTAMPTADQIAPQGPTVLHHLAFMTGDELCIPIFKRLRQDGTLYPVDAPQGQSDDTRGGQSQDSSPIDRDPIERDTALKIYRTMLFTRVLDERMLAAQRQGRLSFYMQCTGEEATVIGSAAALQDDDMIMAQYREQGALAWRGFSWNIIKAPHAIADYVVVHELCHLVHPNHSKDFWALVGRFDAAFQEHRDWLKRMGRSLI